MLQDAVFTEETTSDDMDLARTLLAERSPEDIAAALARLYRARLPSPEDILDPGERSARSRDDRGRERNVRTPEGDDRPARSRSKAGKSSPRHGMAEASVWFRAAIGKRKNAEARWLLPMICRRGGIDKGDIGAIRILDTTTEFEISERVAKSSPSRSDVQIRKTISASSRWQKLPRLRRLRKSGHTRLGTKPATPITALVEATILVTRQHRGHAASLTANAGRNLAASRFSGRKRNIGTSPAKLDNRDRQAGHLRKPHTEGTQGRSAAADPVALVATREPWRFRAKACPGLDPGGYRFA